MNSIEKNTLKASRGFSILEVLVILILLGIIGAIVISRGSSADPYILQSQDEIVKSHIRYAQSRALHTASDWGMRFAGSRTYNGRSYSNYWLYKGTDVNTPVRFTVANDGKYVVVFDDNSVGVWPLDIATQTTVTFDRWGSPGSTSITLSVANGSDITILRNTGYIY
ncbi:MAG: hypothetical protein JXO48_06200 [Deltaproteobacteria bacterium]|nr:hypothetical protein [Deltaproteobacteria bacterium]